MKGIITACAALAVSGMMMAQPKLTANNIDAVIKAMTLEEKATIVVGTGMAGFSNSPVIGSSSSLVPGAAGTTAAIPRLGIPSIVLSDGPAGVRINPERNYDHNKYYATHFPIGTALACSWNTTLVSEVGKAIGEEASAYGVEVMLSPGVCLMRNPLCGRNFEYYSEDPVLSGNIAAAYISGIQSQGVGTSIKHFAFNNQETQRMGNDARVSQRAARELYLKNFEIAITKAQPWTVMSSYNLVNGTLTSESHDLLTSVLRNDWGFKGLVMTDWFGGMDPVRRGGKTDRAANIHAGNDLIEPGLDQDRADIVAAVKSGKLSVKDLDTCVRRVLELVVKTKRFQGYKYDNKPDLTAHAQVTRQGAAEGSVLLKNNAALPFTHVKNVALYGCGSYDLVAGGTGSGNVNRAYTISLVEGMRNAGYNVDVDLINEYTPYIEDYYKKNPKPGPLDLKVPTLPSEKDVKVTDEEVSRNDIAVITLHRISGEGQDRTIAQYNLEDNEKALIKNVCDAYHKAGKKVVVVLNIGGAIETASWKNEPDAILVPWQCGQEIGNSIADLLSGKSTPSGKLSMTWPVKVEDDPSTANFPANTSGYDINGFSRDASKFADVKNIGYTDYDEDIYVGYRYYDTFKKNVSYPFGYGLSYTTFSYSGVKAADNGNTVTVTATITNTGKRAGKEVAEVYVTAPKGKVEKPAQELKAFAKTRTLQPGESETLTMTIDKIQLASFVTAQSAWVADAGTYTFKVGASSRDIKGTATLNLKGLKKKVSNALAPKTKLHLLSQK
jgi:beta-glucosidase